MAAAYFRRRGWLAWKTATLQRFDYEDGYPSLAETMGISVPAAPVQSEAAMLHAVRMWNAAFRAKQTDRQELRA